MISIELKLDEIIVTPIGDINFALKKMQLVSEKKWSPSMKAWTVPKSKAKEVIALFGININFLTPLTELLKSDSIDDNAYASTEGFDGLKCTLYPFQTVGANFATRRDGGALIADVMGLGKTLQALGAFTKEFNKGIAKKMLVVCPASVKYQWGEEVESKTKFKHLVIDTPSKMKGRNSAEREANALKQFDDIKNVQIVITNYETLLNEALFKKFKECKFDMIAGDEIHMVKNRTAGRSKKVYELAKLIDKRIGLSGTPLENRPDELFGVFQFIEPKLFPNWSKFSSEYIKFVRYGIVGGYKNLPQLRTKIQPYIIRRTLNDVSLQMPEKRFSTKIIEMTASQRKLHDQLYEEIMEHFEELKEARSKYSHLITPDANGEYNPDNEPEQIKRVKAAIMGKFTFLLEICDSPELLAMSDSNIAKRYDVKDMESPKLEALVEIVEQVVNQGDKIIVFTQYSRMIKIIKARMEKEFKRVKVAIIDGSVDAKQRIVQKNMFIDDPNCQIMLLSDAGNFGLNLQNANYLVMFEPPLKPSIYDQRVGRIVRIGSKHQNAFIINLVMNDGWDQKIFDILEKKREFTRLLVDKTDKESTAFNKAADNIQKDMESMIKKIAKKKAKGESK